MRDVDREHRQRDRAGGRGRAREQREGGDAQGEAEGQQRRFEAVVECVHRPSSDLASGGDDRAGGLSEP
ncbi:hypothetical protein FV232_14375 [Methylobacterium sp. WL30]|nr:hypothetical protein FV223_17185 [Methylobacterium sp. WL116]TXN36493.1 hypothetical protein FV225_14810 [Methylobacterium sp. WL93]TXN49713.1 hypothetical protein FV227_15460 [Methylobacterium sp. WL119]TXN66767.1 hypothetical protein FV232_14375 [Methylobacterium sp. WL30]